MNLDDLDWLVNLGDPTTIANAARESLLQVAPGPESMRTVLDQVISVGIQAAGNRPETDEIAVLWGLVVMLATAYSLTLSTDE